MQCWRGECRPSGLSCGQLRTRSCEHREASERSSAQPCRRAKAVVWRSSSEGRAGNPLASNTSLSSVALIFLAIALEPFALNQAAAQRRRRLLILAGEVVFADRPPAAVK